MGIVCYARAGGLATPGWLGLTAERGEGAEGLLGAVKPAAKAAGQADQSMLKQAVSLLGLRALQRLFGGIRLRVDSVSHRRYGGVMPEQPEVRQVKETHREAILARPNVVGVGARTGAVALVVMVTHKVPRGQSALQDVIPAEIEGVPVDVQEVGEIRAQV